MRALITGATGFIGGRLLRVLPEAVVLSRDAQRAQRALEPFRVTAHAWQPAEEPAPAAAFEGVEVVFHLAGESLAEGRWTAAKKKRLRDSRVAGTRRLVAGLKQLSDRPRVLIAASAIGYYGNRGDLELVESDPPGTDFLAELCVEWEDAAREAESLGIRVVHPRIGIVLGTAGGVLAKLQPIFRAGLGSPLGDGQQWISWIHQDDLVGLMMFAAQRDDLHGALNATAPHPVTSRQFTKMLAEALHRPALLPAVPRFALRMALGEFADALTASQRVLPANAQKAGFSFQHAQLREALEHVLQAGDG